MIYEVEMRASTINLIKLISYIVVFFKSQESQEYRIIQKLKNDRIPFFSCLQGETMFIDIIFTNLFIINLDTQNFSARLNKFNEIFRLKLKIILF